MSKILASHMLQGNFTTKKVTSLELEANSVELSGFLSQRNKVLVKWELSSEVKATSENIIDFANSHKTNLTRWKNGTRAINCSYSNKLWFLRSNKCAISVYYYHFLIQYLNLPLVSCSNCMCNGLVVLANANKSAIPDSILIMGSNPCANHNLSKLRT